MYAAPDIRAGAGAAAELKSLNGAVLVITMEIPWKILQSQIGWDPAHVHFVENMDLPMVEAAEAALPPCDIVVGVGGGSCADMAKYVAWKRGCRMILVPSIISVDAPLTNTVAVRVDKKVQYIGDIYPREVIVDYTLIQAAPPELNRAGACDIASIHTALHDWRLAHEKNGEAWDETIAGEAQACLDMLDRNAEEVYAVSPKGIDTIVDLYRREVEFCARYGNSRPEEGSEHLVAYNLEHLTRRHYVHGDIVGLGIFTMARLQDNAPERATDLIKRCGLRFTAPDASHDEVRACLRTLRAFKDNAGLFYSVVDEKEITDEFIDDTLEALYQHA